MKNKDKYTTKELMEFESLTDGLIKWMFSSPNNREPISRTIKEAFDFGKSSHKKGSEE